MVNKTELKERLVTGHVITERDMHDLIDVSGEQGPQGVPGKDGIKGDPGPQGSPGADGFGTKEQYDAIIARLDELEKTGE